VALNLHKDEWKRPEVYFAEYETCIGSGGKCLFSRLDPAIFFVLTGLGRDIDWDNFPDPSKKYPYEDRDASNLGLTPVFIVKQKSPLTGREVRGQVTKMVVSDSWTVGNGVAEYGHNLFLDVTCRPEVKLTGKGQSLSGVVKGKKEGI